MAPTTEQQESRVFTALQSFKDLQQHETQRRNRMAFAPNMNSKPASAQPTPFLKQQPSTNAQRQAPSTNAAPTGKPELTLEQKVERLMKINDKVVEKVKELQAEVKELRAVVQALGGSGVSVSEDPFA